VFIVKILQHQFNLKSYIHNNFLTKFKKNGILKFNIYLLFKNLVKMIQLSVFLEDRPGELANFIKLLMDNKIFIRALTVAKTSEYGLILILVDNPEKCINLLEKKDFLISTTHVIAVRLNDHPKALYEIPKTLGEHKINIDYFYSTLVKDESMLILRVEDTIIEEAIDILEKKGFTIVER